MEEPEVDTGSSERERSVACLRYGYFILGHFIVLYIMRCMDKMQAYKMLVDKTPVKIVEDKILALFGDREYKMLRAIKLKSL